VIVGDDPGEWKKTAAGLLVNNLLYVDMTNGVTDDLLKKLYQAIVAIKYN